MQPNNKIHPFDYMYEEEIDAPPPHINNYPIVAVCEKSGAVLRAMGYLYKQERGPISVC